MPHRWSKAAKIRKEQIETGVDVTFHKVFLPLYDRIFNNLSPASVIDVGAGTGHLAKYLKRLCEKLVAIEPSQGMYEVARETLSGSGVELVNSSSFDYSTRDKFDLCYSHMCAHTVDSLSDFLSSFVGFVADRGLLVLSIPHPVFYSLEKKYFGGDFNYLEEISGCVGLTISKDLSNVIEGVPFHHRPISSYINTIVSSGFDIVEMKEVGLSPEEQIKYGVSWSGPRYCFFICSLKRGGLPCGVSFRSM